MTFFVITTQSRKRESSPFIFIATSINQALGIRHRASGKPFLFRTLASSQLPIFLTSFFLRCHPEPFDKLRTGSVEGWASDGTGENFINSPLPWRERAGVRVISPPPET